MSRSDDLKARFGTSKDNNFAVVDTIGVPHPYMIGAKLVGYAADKFSGMLNEEAIASAERNGIMCAHPGCGLKYSEHKQALLVQCHAKIAGDDEKATPELHEYLLACRKLLTSDEEYAGFAFTVHEYLSTKAF